MKIRVDPEFLGSFRLFGIKNKIKNNRGKFRPTAVVAIKNEKDLSPPDTPFHLTQGKESQLLPEGLCGPFQGPLLISVFHQRSLPTLRAGIKMEVSAAGTLTLAEMILNCILEHSQGL